MISSSEWPLYPIREVYTGLFDGPHATPPPAEDGPVFLGIRNVTENGHLDLTEIRHIAEVDYPAWTRRVNPQAGDIVFTYEATLNRYAIVPEGFRGCLGRRMALIRPDTSKIDVRFLFQYFFSLEWRRTIEGRILRGSTVDRIPLTDFPDFPVRVPPLEVQRRIAHVLSAYDDLIENNLRRIRILEEMARAIYREWFVHYRFPRHERITLEDSQLGPAPRGWAIRFGDLVTIERNGVNPGDFEQETFEHFSIPAYDEGQLPVLELGEAVRSNKYLITDQCILLSKLNPRISRVWLVRPSGEYRAIASTEFLVMKPRRDEVRALIYASCLDEVFQGRFAGLAVGTSTSHQRVKPQDFLVMATLMPEGDVLAAFRQPVEPMIELVTLLRRQNANLRATRDLLLPRLMSGRLSLAQADAGVEVSRQPTLDSPVGARVSR